MNTNICRTACFSNCQPIMDFLLWHFHFSRKKQQRNKIVQRLYIDAENPQHGNLQF